MGPIHPVAINMNGGQLLGSDYRIMTCNRLTKPEFTDEFIAKHCGTPEKPLCKFASAQIRFCQKFGKIGEQKIIVPDKKIKYPSMAMMGKSFVKAGAKHIRSGMKKRTKAEQNRCIAVCKNCEFYVEKTKIGPRCQKCGCNMKVKSRWATAHCPLGKW